MNNDLISRSDLKKAIETYDKFACLPDCKLEPFRNLEHPEMFEPYVHLRDILNAIDNAPTVEERPQGKWIPVTMRPIEEEEKIDYPYATFMFDCPMPENGQNILVSTKYGVEYDTCYLYDGYYLDSDRDWEEVYAWQPLPEPYKEATDDD